MKASTHIMIVVILFLVAIGGTWWIRGEWKDREFAARLAASPHTTHTGTIEKEIPNPPEHAKIGPLPARSDSSESDLARADSIFAAGWFAGNIEMRSIVRKLSAPFDTTIHFKSKDTLRLRFDPVTRMLVADLIPAPRKEIEHTRVDSIFVPVPEHDSFATRATIFTAGAATVAIIIAFTH